ncbi:unnamed protein product, partial [Brenthis ino]
MSDGSPILNNGYNKEVTQNRYKTVKEVIMAHYTILSHAQICSGNVQTEYAIITCNKGDDPQGSEAV